MTSLELYKIIRPIIINVTGVPVVILANPNEAAPKGPYAAVQPKQSVNQEGQANNYRENNGTDNLDVDSRAQVVAECSVNFYRGDAVTFAELLQQANRKQSVADALFKSKVGWKRTGPINNLTFLQSNNWENRAQISIFLTYEEVSNPETINSIERVPFELQNKDADILLSGEVVTPDAP